MFLGALIVMAFVALTGLHLREARQERQRRGEFFADTLPLFDACTVKQETIDFPVLEGRYQGQQVRLEPVLDDMGVRKVPSLWLKVTVLSPNPDRGTLDLLVRPQGIEFYSPSNSLARKLSIPAGWPQHAILSTDRSGQVPSFDRLTRHMKVFADPKTKEMLITPLGVRLVYQAAQARRSEYLVLRQSRFEIARLDPTLVRTLLDRAVAIAQELDGAVHTPPETIAA